MSICHNSNIVVAFGAASEALAPYAAMITLLDVVLDAETIKGLNSKMGRGINRGLQTIEDSSAHLRERMEDLEQRICEVESRAKTLQAASRLRWYDPFLLFVPFLFRCSHANDELMDCKQALNAASLRLPALAARLQDIQRNERSLRERLANIPPGTPGVDWGRIFENVEKAVDIAWKVAKIIVVVTGPIVGLNGLPS